MKASQTAIAAAALGIYLVGGASVLGGVILMVIQGTGILGGSANSGLGFLLIALGLGFSVAGVVLMRISRSGYGREGNRP